MRIDSTQIRDRFYGLSFYLVFSRSEAQTKAGKIAEALQLTQFIKEEDAGSDALVAIVEAQAKAGRVAEALQLSQSIKNEGARAKGLVAIGHSAG